MSTHKKIPKKTRLAVYENVTIGVPIVAVI